MKKRQDDLSDLIKRWEREDLTTEQAIGQLLLWLVVLSERMTELEVNVRKINHLQ
jgi:hypothetical protein